MKVRKHFYFSGQVQGVGFRYRAVYIARGLGLTGCVRNLWDGRVELEAQGEEESVNRLLKELNRASYIRIDGIETEDMPLKEEGGFQVTR